MSERFLGKVTSINLSHPLKAEDPIEVTLFGIITFERLKHL